MGEMADFELEGQFDEEDERNRRDLIDNEEDDNT
jgi:hypothetical protein